MEEEYGCIILLLMHNLLVNCVSVAISKRTLVVEDLPRNPNEEDLKEIFPDATYIMIPQGKDDRSKG